MNGKVKLKRYAIHILAVPVVTAEAFDLPPDRNALIVCGDRTNRFIDSDTDIRKIVLPFADVEDEKRPDAFTDALASAAARFLRELPESVTDLYVCCSKGGSRSPAIAAAVLKASGRSDGPVWKNPFYVPNGLVYRKMCAALGVFMPRSLVRYKKYINAAAYRKAKRKRSAGEFDRWQIIF